MKMIGRYEIRGLLGKGGMGAVYKARLPELGKIVALKVLVPEEIMEAVVGMEELTRQFRREARLVASIRHPHVAQVWDYSEEGGVPHFSMEYLCSNLGSVMGETYLAEAPSRRIPPDRAAAYALQTLSALARLHHEGTVHRDVKPFNIMLTEADRVKLIDFGLSRLRGETGSAAPSNIKIGTPFYTAPEQERDPESADHRADLFSVGIMLYRMLFGVMPPESGEARVPQGEMPGDLVDGWNEFFGRALAPKPEDRFADAHAMAQALDERVRAWKDSLDAVCTMSEEALLGCDVDRPGLGTIRSVGGKIRKADAREAFGTDELGRPECFGERNFILSESKETVVDKATGLEWERDGSAYPMSWEEACARAEALDARSFDGKSGWRLPTVPELLSLVGPRPDLDSLCLDEVFDPSRHQLWSADRKSFMAAWYLDAPLGFVSYQDYTCNYHARCVRTRSGDE